MKVTRFTKFDDLPEILVVPEAAAWLSCSTGKVYEAIRSGDIEAVRIGRLVRISKSELATKTGRVEPNDA